MTFRIAVITHRILKLMKLRQAGRFKIFMISRRVPHRIMSGNRTRVWIPRGGMFRRFSYYSPLLLVAPVEDDIDSFPKGEVLRIEKCIAESFACVDSTDEAITQSLLRELTEVTSRCSLLKLGEEVDQ